MHERAPKVSVLMPVYNALPYLAQALESILGQTFEDFELIAVDDGSDDGSGGVLDEYAGRDGRLRVIHANHGGLVAALCSAHGAARGEYLARMDGDDVSYAERLQRQVKLLDAQGEVAVVSCAADILDEDGHRTGVWAPELHEDMLLELAAGNPIVHGSVMMRRSDFENAGGYQQPPEDYDLWIRMAKQDAKFSVVRGDPPRASLYGFRAHAKRYSLARLAAQSEAILRVQVPLLEEAVERYCNEAQALLTGETAGAKLLEGWGRVGGAAWVCHREDLARRAVECVDRLYRSVSPRESQLRNAFHTAADAIVWSGAPYAVALRMRLRQLRLQPASMARWRDAAMAILGIGRKKG